MAADCSNETHFDWNASVFGDVTCRGWSVCLMSVEARVESTTWSEERSCDKRTLSLKTGI